MLHAGGENGWVDGVGLVFKSKTNSADYCDEMNSEHFLEWMREQLLPTLEEPSVIILDNASYHNKQYNKPPTSSNNKKEIRDWLQDNNIHCEATDIKSVLLDRVKKHRPAPIYLADELAHQHGHSVLCLPVGHCELNPIELALASVKGYVAKNNSNYNLTSIQRLVHTTPNMWKNFCKHVKEIEEQYIEKDGRVEDTLEEMVIELGEEDTDDEKEMIDDADR